MAFNEKGKEDEEVGWSWAVDDTMFVAAPLATRHEDRHKYRSGSGVSESDGKNAWFWAELNDEWVALYRLVEQQGIPVVGELRIFPLERDESGKPLYGKEWGSWSGVELGINAQIPKGGLKTRVVRMANLGQHLQEAEHTISLFHTILASQDVEVSFEKTLHEACSEELCYFSADKEKCPKAAKPTRGRRRTIPDLYLARLARDYVQIIQKTKSRKPVVDLARKRKLDESRTRSLIHTARERGILMPRGIQGQNRTAWLSKHAKSLLSGLKKPKTKQKRSSENAKKR